MRVVMHAELIKSLPTTDYIRFVWRAECIRNYDNSNMIKFNRVENKCIKRSSGVSYVQGCLKDFWGRE